LLPLSLAGDGEHSPEDIVYLLRGMGHETGIDLDALIGVAEWMAERLG
jgi:hypothetical protein